MKKSKEAKSIAPAKKALKTGGSKADKAEKRPKKPHPFADWQTALSDTERQAFDEYYKRLCQHLALSKKENYLMLRDFRTAILYYHGKGLELAEIMERLSPAKLGGYYARPPYQWFPLDDAAKIYPLSMKRNCMSVFRLSVYLHEEIVPELLQMALTFTIKRFPSFATTIKAGFFWHYIDATKRRFTAEPENDMPCNTMNVSVSGSQSFRVLYYKNRISVEFFHILTDGTGGMMFLKTLTAEYLRLLGEDIPCDDGILDIGDAPDVRETANDFPKAATSEKPNGFGDSRAVPMSGRLSVIRPCQVLHFEIPAEELRAKAKEKGFTVTAYTLALMFMASRFATDETKGNIQIQVPINMRQYYHSRTLRNFSMFCNIKIPVKNISSVDDILPEIAKQLKERASKEAMTGRINSAVKLVHGLRFVPLFMKRPAAIIAYGFMGDRVFTNTLSNLGVVKMPTAMASHVEKMDFLLGTSVTNRAACAMVTAGGVASLCVSKWTADPSFENKLYELMEKDGLKVCVKGSELYED